MMKSSSHQTMAWWQRSATVVVGLASLIGGCNSPAEEARSSHRTPAAEAKAAPPASPAPKARAVTSEIQRGIERIEDLVNRHIEMSMEDN